MLLAWVLVNLIKNLPTAHITRPGTASVVFNSFSGLQRGRVLRPGAAFLTPGVERGIPYEVRIQVWEFTDQSTSRVASNPVSAIAADGQSFSINVNIALRLNPDTLDDLHAKIGENYILTSVVPLVRSKFRDVAAKFQSEDFYRRDRRLEVEKQAKELINAELPKTQKDGKNVPMMSVEWVYMETAAFPPALRESIEKKQVAGILAQTAGVRAQIQQKETDRALILAKANERAIELKGRAALLGGP
ncbi:MAG: prohibitin family protein [Oscillatoriales cyanobacterium SM2_2_1]|nr:prohibitin family protein [Oscillatoriales cyanobacterium SM2_2_1]